MINGTVQRIENVYEYDSFGNTIYKEEEIHNPFRYTGQQYDPLTGLYYLRSRFYNPATARFTQEDSYYGDGLNLYAYCRNNPVNYYDPEGHAKCPVEAAKKALKQLKGGSDAQIVYRAVTPEQAKSIRAGNGIVKPKPYAKTNPTQHVGGVKHKRNPWTSTTRRRESAKFFQHMVVKI